MVRTLLPDLLNALQNGTSSDRSTAAKSLAAACDDAAMLQQFCSPGKRRQQQCSWHMHTMAYALANVLQLQTLSRVFKWGVCYIILTRHHIIFVHCRGPAAPDPF
jgi:hypothetical protein